MAREIYQPTEWKDFPSTETPINSENLNKLENGLSSLDSYFDSFEDNYTSTISDVYNRLGTLHITAGRADSNAKSALSSLSDVGVELYTIKSNLKENTYGFLTEETDPTVPAWAKEATKPTYTASEVGALPEDTQLFSGNYNDLTNKPEIPTIATTEKAGIVKPDGKTITVKTDGTIEAEQKPYTSNFFKQYFAMQRTGKIYTVRFPLWETSQVSTGEKLDDNANMVCEPSTTTIAGRDDYQSIGLFRTYDVTAKAVDGEVEIIALKGDENYDPENDNVFVLGMPYYEKFWNDEQYFYISRTDTKLEGYELCPEGKNADGTEKAFCLYAKYVAGRGIYNNKLGSYINSKPERKFSHNECVNKGKALGEGIVFGHSADYKYLQTTFMLKYANKNMNSVLGGCFSFNKQCYVAQAGTEESTSIILNAADAEYLYDESPFKTRISVGVGNGTNAVDRGNSSAHVYGDSVQITGIHSIGDGTLKELTLATGAFLATENTYISSMPYSSGYSSYIKGRDGCYCKELSKISSLKYPSVLQGIEFAVGGYEVLGNAFIDFAENGMWDVYTCSDIKKITTNVATAKNTYRKCSKQIQSTNNTWKYITEMTFDKEISFPTSCGENGSGSGSGYCDGINTGAEQAGQREFLLLGDLGAGVGGGSFCAGCWDGLSFARWYLLARLSYSGLRG